MHELSLASDEPPPTRKSDVDPLRLPSVPPLQDSDPPELGGRLPLRHDFGRGGASEHTMATAVPQPTQKAGPTDSPRGRVPLPRPPTAGNPQVDRRRTAPEPIVERSIDRVEAGVEDPAGRLARRNPPDSLELDLGGAQDSPLELAETYRRATESMPRVSAETPSERAAGSRESGTLQDMQDRYAVGDFTGALVVAESILDADPENEDARRYAQSCREVLTQMYAARIGPMDQVATVAVPPEQITWLSLDHRAGFLLSLVDGISSIDEILDISGMSRLDALRIMYTLVQQNVITLSQ